MTDVITAWIETFVSSGWIYPAVTFLVFLDCIFPVAPGEAVLTVSGAWAGSTGQPHALVVFGLGVAAAIIGDTICYFAGTRVMVWTRSLPRRSSIGRAVAWVDTSMRQRAGVTIMMARFIPWGRWVLIITLGGIRYPFRRFFFFETLGVLFWAGQAVAIGYFAGFLVQDIPLLGLVIGLVFGALAGLLIDRTTRGLIEQREVRSGVSRA